MAFTSSYYNLKNKYNNNKNSGRYFLKRNLIFVTKLQLRTWCMCIAKLCCTSNECNTYDETKGTTRTKQNIVFTKSSLSFYFKKTKPKHRVDWVCHIGF